jgi:hypothetical protein
LIATAVQTSAEVCDLEGSLAITNADDVAQLLFWRATNYGSITQSVPPFFSA